MKRPGVAAVLTAAGLLLLANPAGAQESGSVEAGWWTSNPLPPPDAPEDGLVVQGSIDAENPTAYAAVAATLPTGSTALSLTLRVAEGSASTSGATLAVCLLTDSFTPAQGGPAEEAPAYDCDATEVTAAASDDGTSYTWDLSAMPDPEAVAVAVLPTAPTDRVVFAAPTAESVEFQAAPPPADVADESGTPEPSGDFVTPSDDVGSPSGSGSSFDIPGPATATLPEVPRTTPTLTPPSAPARPVAAQPVAAGAVDDDGRSLAPFILGALAALAAILWGTAGRGTEGDPENEPAY